MKLLRLVVLVLPLWACAASHPAGRPAAAKPTAAPEGWWITVSSTMGNGDVGTGVRFAPEVLTAVETSGSVVRPAMHMVATGAGAWRVQAPKGEATLREGPPGTLTLDLVQDEGRAAKGRVIFRRATPEEAAKLEEAVRSAPPRQADEDAPPPAPAPSAGGAEPLKRGPAPFPGALGR